MRVLIIPPTGNNIHPMDIDGTLASLQDLVGGFIQTANMPQLNEKGIELVVNEEGLLAGLPYNENLWPFFFVGHAFMIGVAGDEFTSLTESQIEFARNWLNNLS